MNHRRSNAPVGYCPDCGQAVNKNLAPRECSAEAHATARRRQSSFCVHCGTRLVQER